MLCPSKFQFNLASNQWHFKSLPKNTFFNGRIIAFFRIELFPSAAVFSNNLALHLKDLKALVFATLESKLVAPSLE